MLGEVFDPTAELFIAELCRPHWSQVGAIVFATFRTHDSIPKEVIERWDREKQDWMNRLGIARGVHWSKAMEDLSDKDRNKFNQHFNRCREDLLDNNLGRCVLRDVQNAKIVADSLLHFDGERYRMGDFVIMPNHVHLLCAFGCAEAMTEQFDSWLHYTARQINLRQGRKGKLWQGEPFDHLVRSPEQYDYLRRYIQENPEKAKLPENDFLYRRYEES